jgi:hypothetical protein
MACRAVAVDDLLTRLAIYGVGCLALAAGYAGALTLSGLSWKPDIFTRHEEPSSPAEPETVA